MAIANFLFHGELNDFLPRQSRSQPVSYAFKWRASVKDMIEAIAPPHCEVEAILVDQQPVGFDYIVSPDDKIDVYDYLTAPVHAKTSSSVKPELVGKPRFILDTHLGRLASYLRMMGFDTLYRNDYADDELAEISHQDTRVLLTRDLGLLKRSLVIYGRFVRTTNPQKQVLEIADRYQLATYIEPFQHCIKCNGIVKKVEQSEVVNLLSSRTLTYYSEFHQCQSCEQVYWKGSHYQKMLAFINEIAPLEK